MSFSFFCCTEYVLNLYDLLKLIRLYIINVFCIPFDNKIDEILHKFSLARVRDMIHMSTVSMYNVAENITDLYG